MGDRDGKRLALEPRGYVYLLIARPGRRGKSSSCDPDLHFVKQLCLTASDHNKQSPSSNTSCFVSRRIEQRRHQRVFIKASEQVELDNKPRPLPVGPTQ